MNKTGFIMLRIFYAFLCCLTLFIHCNAVSAQSYMVRVPAEWERHEATWMQWPGTYEEDMIADFIKVASKISHYETVNIIIQSEYASQDVLPLFKKGKANLENIRWHYTRADNIWARSNGPIYVGKGRRTWIQNWRFDAWGGLWGVQTDFKNDNYIPVEIGRLIDVPVEDIQHYVLERGNIETNGQGAFIINWDVQNQRNPNLTMEQHETILRTTLGARKILWAYGYNPRNGLTGHIDNTARFISADTIAITTIDSETNSNLIAEAYSQGFKIVRYPSSLNWYVGNGFLLTLSTDDPKQDQILKQYLQAYFPRVEISFLNLFSISSRGCGIHCITSDQPTIISR